MTFGFSDGTPSGVVTTIFLEAFGGENSKTYADVLRSLGKNMMESEGFENAVAPGVFAPRPEERPLTKFEKRGQNLGHGVWDLLFYRTN